ncbi:membrane protein [soil metagenome]
MSDPNQWQAPGGEHPVAPGPALPPHPGSMPPPQYGYAPPPPPGLIPLRPLTLGTILGATFRVFRRNPGPTVGLSLGLNAIWALLFVLIAAGFAAFAISRVSLAAPSEQGDIIAGTVLAGGLTLLIPVAASIAISGVLQGIVALEVSRATIGEKLRARGLFRLARGRIGALVGWALLVTLAWIVALAVVAGAVTLLIIFGGQVGLIVGIILAVLAGLGLAALAVWIGTKVSLVPSVLLIEHVPLRSAIARSWSLTNRSFFKTLGIQLLVSVIVGTASQIISIPISVISGIVSAIVAPTGDPTTVLVVAAISELVAGVVGIVIQSVTTVMISSTAALIYLDLRMRKEGLDLELMRFVEARQSGDASVTDPYRVVPAAAR